MDRLLHHVAELAGGDGLPLAGHRRGLDRQQLAADFGPGEAGDLADLVLLLGHAEGVAAHAEKLVEVLRRDGNAMTLLVTRLLSVRSCFTALRQILESSRSSARTPASRV